MTNITVKESGIHGKGIYATRDFKRGNRIANIAGRKVKFLSKSKNDALAIPTWFGIGRYTWIDPEKTPFRFLNHSCDPNAAISGTRTLIAISDIKAGSELTIDYSMTDADLLWEMNCKCNSITCRKTIRSIHSVPTEVFKKHMPYIPRYFQRLYIRNYIRTAVQSESK